MKIFGRILGVLFVIAVMLLCVCSAFSQTSGNTPPPPPVCGSTNAGAIYTDTGTTPPTVYTCSYYNLEWQWNVNPIYGGLVYESSVPGTCSGALPVYVAGWPNTEVYVCENGIPEPIPSPGETVGVSGSITNGHCASWSSSNSITDAGFPCGSSSGTVSSGTAGQLAVYTGSSTVAGKDVWLREAIPVANCASGVPASAFSLPYSAPPQAVCRTGTYLLAGYLQFTASQCAQFQDEIPGDWDISVGPYIQLNYTQANATSSQSIIFTVQAAASSTDDSAFNTAQTYSTTTTGSTANYAYTNSVQLNSTSMNNWSAGMMANFKICTASGSNATVNLQLASITWPHAKPGTAGAY